MPAGRKPCLTITANAKDAPKGQKKTYIELGAAWENDLGGMSMTLAKGTLIKLADGTILSGDKFWFNVKDWREKSGAKNGDGDGNWEAKKLDTAGWDEDPPMKPRAVAPSDTPDEGDDRMPF